MYMSTTQSYSIMFLYYSIFLHVFDIVISDTLNNYATCFFVTY
jgi:hypothetical protein